MPMMPSPLAALAYGAVKVIGYAYFARYLNQRHGESVSPYKFGIVKTAIGLAGGIAYVSVIAPAIWAQQDSHWAFFLGAAPIRFVAWCTALAIFYQFRARKAVVAGMAALGTIWSYVLDGIMWLIYQILPGMVMPFC